jgi:hypothetical protein
VAVHPSASLLARTPIGGPAEIPDWALPQALTVRLFGAELDPEAIQRLVAAVMVQVADRRDGGVDDAQARRAALHIPSPPPASSAPKPAPVGSGAEMVTFPFVLRPDEQSPPLFEFDLQDVPVTDASFDEHLQTAYLLGGSPAVAAVCGGLALQSQRHRYAAEEAADAQTWLINSRSSDVSGKTEAMLIPEEDVARRGAAAAGQAAVARRYERAEEVCANARTRHQKRVAEVRDRFTDAAVRALARRLARSRAELVEQAERYGLKPDDVYTGDDALLMQAHLTAIRPQQRQAVRSVKSILGKLAEARAATTLAERDASATEILSPIIDAIAAAAVLFGSGDQPFTNPGPGSPGATAEVVRAHAREARSNAALALARYSAARAVATVAHPAVRLIPDPVPLEAGTVTDEILAVRLAKSLARVHRSIDIIEARVLGPQGFRDRVYGYPALVLGTLREMGLEPTSLEAVVAREVGERRRAVEEELDNVLGWAGIIVPLLAAVVTGGAGAVLAGLLLDVGNVMTAAEKYEVGGAEFSSALSAVEALGQQDPSRVEIGIAVAFAMLNVVV